MDTRTDERLNELEIKLSFMDDMLEQLNQIIIRQQASLDLLARELSALKAQSPDATAPNWGDATARARDNLPPHY
jgi:SlyX protein